MTSIGIWDFDTSLWGKKVMPCFTDDSLQLLCAGGVLLLYIQPVVFFSSQETDLARTEFSLFSLFTVKTHFFQYFILQTSIHCLI